MMRMRFSWGLIALIVAAVAIMLQAPDVWAAGDDISVGSLTCSGGTAAGQLLISGASCPTTLKFDNIFSFLICNFEQLSSNIMGHMFCGMINNLTPAVWAAVSLAVLIFGISFTIGLIPATGAEAMMFVIKLSFITGFATNADALIGFGYNFLITGMREGVTIAVSTMTGAGVNSGADVYVEVDKLLSQFFHYATDYMSATNTADMCKNALFAVIALLFVVLPVAAYVSLLLIGRLVLTLFRCVFAYIYALMGITFLLVLAPFFLSFYLFKATRNLFDRWIGYLVSFTLQVVLLFAFLTFIVILVKDVQNNNVANELTTLVMKKEQTVAGTSFSLPLSYCTLCDFEVVDKTSGTKLNPGDADYISKGKLQCKTPKTEITPNFASSPDGKNQIKSLLDFMGYGLIGLIVIILMIEQLLGLIPSLAQKLASGLGASYATQLGGGPASGASGSVRLPGESYIDNFSAGFESGFADKGSSTTIGKGVQGVKDGLSALVTGKTTSGGIVSNADGSQGGIQNSFARWLKDPSSFGQ